MSLKILCPRWRYCFKGINSIDAKSDLVRNTENEMNRVLGHFCAHTDVSQKGMIKCKLLSISGALYYIHTHEAGSKWPAEGLWVKLGSAFESIWVNSLETIFNPSSAVVDFGDPRTERLNPLTAKLFNLNFYPLEAVSRWRDPQLQVLENYSDFTKW